jgi:hypothetical protein
MMREELVIFMDLKEIVNLLFFVQYYLIILISMQKDIFLLYFLI